MRTTWMSGAVACVVLHSGSLCAQTPVGQWTLQVEWPAAPATVALIVSDSAGDRRVSWVGPQGTLTATDVEWSDGRIAFVLAMEDQDREPLRLRFQARIDGEELRGELAGPASRIVIPVTGRPTRER